MRSNNDIFYVFFCYCGFEILEAKKEKIARKT